MLGLIKGIHIGLPESFGRSSRLLASAACFSGLLGPAHLSSSNAAIQDESPSADVGSGGMTLVGKARATALKAAMRIVMELRMYMVWLLVVECFGRWFEVWMDGKDRRGSDEDEKNTRLLFWKYRVCNVATAQQRQKNKMRILEINRWTYRSENTTSEGMKMKCFLYPSLHPAQASNSFESSYFMPSHHI